jgi:rubrerythrin
MNAIEVSISMETDAIKFYTEAADKTSHPVGKKMFLAISEDEKRHLKMLSDLFKGLDITIEDVSPMEGVKSVFAENKDAMMKRIEASSDDINALKVAMDMEAKGKEFYEKAAAEAKTEKEKALFERLVKEEEEHFRIFSNTANFLTDTGNWFMWEEHSIVEG